MIKINDSNQGGVGLGSHTYHLGLKASVLLCYYLRPSTTLVGIVASKSLHTPRSQLLANTAYYSNSDETRMRLDRFTLFLRQLLPSRPDRLDQSCRDVVGPCDH